MCDTAEPCGSVRSGAIGTNPTSGVVRNSVAIRGKADVTRTGCWRVESGWSEAHILAMDQILPPELSAFEFESLRQIAAHPTAHHVPSHVQSRLKDIGYVKEVLGSLIVTDDGLQRIALNKSLTSE
jgi:hypothetical protein